MAKGIRVCQACESVGAIVSSRSSVHFLLEAQ